MTAYEVAKSAFLVCIVFMAGALAGRALPLLDELKADSASVAKNADDTAKALETALASIQAIELNTTRTEAEMAGLLNATRKSMLTQKQVLEITQHVNQLLGDADASVNRFNTETLPAFNGLVSSGHSLVSASGDSVRTLSQQGAILLSAGSSAIEATQPVIGHIDKASANLEGTTADLKTIADQWAAPIKGAWGHIKAFLFAIAGPAANVATAIK